MIVPVQPTPTTPPETALQIGSSLVAGRSFRSSKVPENPRPASIHIGSLIVEVTSSISTAALRDGFRDAWLRSDHTARDWNAEAFHRELTVDLPPDANGRELGRRLAEAILRRVSAR